MNINEIPAGSCCSRSKLTWVDWTINPYVGCTGGCLYCYAETFKRFFGHAGDPWGDFLDVKRYREALNPASFTEKDVILFSSVTDPYNPYEEKFRLTRSLLEQLLSSRARVVIQTRYCLVTRDADLLSRFYNIQVWISVNTSDENLLREMEPGTSGIRQRIAALKFLHRRGIRTVLNISPFLPGLTDWEGLLEEAADYTDQICFQKLELKSRYYIRMMEYIKEKHPGQEKLYREIYIKKNQTYWKETRKEITEHCVRHHINVCFL